MREAEEIVVEERSRHVAERGDVEVVTAPEARRSPAAALWEVVKMEEGEGGGSSIATPSYPQVSGDVQAQQEVSDMSEVVANLGMFG